MLLDKAIHQPNHKKKIVHTKSQGMNEGRVEGITNQKPEELKSQICQASALCLGRKRKA